MRVLVHFHCNRKQEKVVIDSAFIEEEMDAIEYHNQQHKDFSWTPNRNTQIQVIREDVECNGYVDPFTFSWPFRREFFVSQAQCSSR